MPVWICPKCGEVVENFSWDEKPWNNHVCNEMRKKLPIRNDLTDTDIQVKELIAPIPASAHQTPKHKNNNLLDFF